MADSDSIIDLLDSDQADEDVVYVLSDSESPPRISAAAPSAPAAAASPQPPARLAAVLSHPSAPPRPAAAAAAVARTSGSSRHSRGGGPGRASAPPCPASASTPANVLNAPPAALRPAAAQPSAGSAWYTHSELPAPAAAWGTSDDSGELSSDDDAFTCPFRVAGQPRKCDSSEQHLPGTRSPPNLSQLGVWPGSL